MRATEFDPQALEHAEERLFALRAAARKFAVPVDDLAELRDSMHADLADLDAGEERLHLLETQAVAARDSYDSEAKRLSEARANAAAGLTRAVMAELPALKLERAEFIVDLSHDAEDRTADGVDHVEFWVRTNPGTRPGPLMKIASGGELSRFLLALKVALADRGSAPTLVFDEIDAGVGGSVADAIGQRLARLAERVQVLSVTHAPQVAARAQTHYLISKTGGADRVCHRRRRDGPQARKEEIARMLAGATVTDEARAAAERLLREAGCQLMAADAGDSLLFGNCRGLTAFAVCPKQIVLVTPAASRMPACPRPRSLSSADRKRPPPNSRGCRGNRLPRQALSCRGHAADLRCGV